MIPRFSALARHYVDALHETRSFLHTLLATLVCLRKHAHIAYDRVPRDDAAGQVNKARKL
jgi:hypothetical protein